MVAVLDGNKCVHILVAAGGERRKWDSSSVQLYRDETFPRRFHEYLAPVLASSIALFVLLLLAIIPHIAVHYILYNFITRSV